MEGFLCSMGGGMWTRYYTLVRFSWSFLSYKKLSLEVRKFPRVPDERARKRRVKFGGFICMLHRSFSRCLNSARSGGAPWRDRFRYKQANTQNGHSFFRPRRGVICMPIPRAPPPAVEFYLLRQSTDPTAVPGGFVFTGEYAKRTKWLNIWILRTQKAAQSVWEHSRRWDGSPLSAAFPRTVVAHLTPRQNWQVNFFLSFFFLFLLAAGLKGLKHPGLLYISW